MLIAPDHQPAHAIACRCGHPDCETRLLWRREGEIVKVWIVNQWVNATVEVSWNEWERVNNATT